MTSRSDGHGRYNHAVVSDVLDTEGNTFCDKSCEPTGMAPWKEFAKEWSIENGNAQIRQLQQERRQLLQRLGELEESEKKLKQVAEEAEEQLTSERPVSWEGHRNRW